MLQIASYRSLYWGSALGYCLISLWYSDISEARLPKMPGTQAQGRPPFMHDSLSER
jgi:hypothetical protein